MHVPRRHALKQGAVVAALLRTGLAAMKKERPQGLETPGPVLEQTVGPRSRQLIDDYLRHVGGSPRAYRGRLPAHMFPQWGFPLLSRTLVDIPYDMTKVLNGGCRIEERMPIPDNEPLHLRAWIENIDDNGQRAILTQKLVTSTPSAPDALEATMFAFVPLKRPEKGAKKKPRPRVPEDVRPIARWRLGPKAGTEFAVLTGDFNPIHWIPVAARAAGFRSCILHGFSTMARAIETVNAQVYSGDVNRIRAVHVKFTRPLLLPAKPGVFLHPAEDGPHGLSVGTNPGGPAFLTGHWEEA